MTDTTTFDTTTSSDQPKLFSFLPSSRDDPLSGSLLKCLSPGLLRSSISGYFPSLFVQINTKMGGGG